MSESWGKIYEKTFTGSMYGAGPTVFAVWAYAIAHMRPPNGSVDINPKMVAGILGCTEGDVEAALHVLCSADADTRTQGEDGRRLLRTGQMQYTAVNFHLYREGRQPEERKTQNREAQAKFRSARAVHSNPVCQPPSATVSRRQPPSAQAEAEAEASSYQPAVDKKGARKRATPPKAPDDVDPQVWDDWLALRKAKRAPVTATVVADAAAEAAKAGMTLEAFLRAWCGRGSQGLRAEWLKPSERPATKAQTFRERDEENAAARVYEMTGGLMGRQKSKPPETIDAGASFPRLTK